MHVQRRQPENETQAQNRSGFIGGNKEKSNIFIEIQRI